MKQQSTLVEIKAYLQKHWLKGTHCPACAQKVKLYKRKLTSGMAVALIRLYEASNADPYNFVHITKLGHLNGGEFAQLKRWGLIEEADNKDEFKRTSGMWAITEKGMRFVRGTVKVDKYIYTYNGKTIRVINVSDETTDIYNALGNKFNYSELMGFKVEPQPQAISWLEE